MADEEQLAILRQGVDAWDAWRREHVDIRLDLTRAHLRGADLQGAHLAKALLHRADLSGMHLRGAILSYANLSGAKLVETDLTGANLTGADLTGSDLFEARLWEANLRRADLSQTRLSRADLSQATLFRTNLRYATLVETRLDRATLTDCVVYGASTWDVHLEGAAQTNLSINAPGEPTITVDNLKIAQFLYLMVHNNEIRDVVDSLTSKVVLILGRFTPERKAVLDALREALRERNYVPVLFDFDVPSERNVTETVTLLARMARFIIADLTEPASIPQELQAIVPDVMVPVQPLLLEGAAHHSMFPDFRRYPWMLPIYRYASLEALLATMQERVIAPAEAKVREVRKLRQAEPGSE